MKWCRYLLVVPLLVASAMLFGCGAETVPNAAQRCDGYYSRVKNRCFPRAQDAGEVCRESVECQYYCACERYDSDSLVGTCSSHPAESVYCALVDGTRELSTDRGAGPGESDDLRWAQQGDP